MNQALILLEDEHLLVVNKPAGMNTHSPSPFAGEGLYDWLRHREPRWADLALIHRLDKETSGVMVFAKTPLANRSLTEQFAQRTVRKKYVLLTDRAAAPDAVNATSALVRAGERYLSRPCHAGGERAETRFRVMSREQGRTLIEAEPLTGRTHQIRVHAAEHGFPILGDKLYGGGPWPRLCLQSQSLAFKHPASHQTMVFETTSDFSNDSRMMLRKALLDEQTDAFRLLHGASDGWPGLYLDRFGEFLLSQAERELTVAQRLHLESLPGVKGAYHKILTRRLGRASVSELAPRLFFGQAADCFVVRENGVRFEVRPGEGYSAGLFLDQRDNRRRILVNHVASKFPLFEAGAAKCEVLNTFAYTCGFSVCAGLAGARVTSLDLSKKYLEWGRRNFALNGLDPSRHDFIYGDVFDWLRRMARKRRAFDLIVLDPPTFSQSKDHGPFRAEKDYGKLVASALPLLKPRGVLLASTNAASFPPQGFLDAIQSAVALARRDIVRFHYVPQPPDFPISRQEPAYLKTVWVQIM